MGVPFVPSAPGTLAFTSGSTAVVGTGTTFTQYQGYDEVWTAAGPLLIASITDDTHLTLRFSFGGSTASGVAYDWTPMPDVSRAQSAAQAIKAMVSNGVLAAIAGVGSAVDKIAYYTGSGTAALTSLTSWARGLLAATSAVAGYDVIKSHAATSVVAASTINLDGANGDLVDVTGITGISAITLADGKERLLHFTGAPLLTAGSNLVLNNGGANYQIAAGDFAIARGGAASLVYLVIIPGDGRDPKTPTGAAGSFERYTGAATSAMQAIVGTVAQSGGVATGSIVETGTNANGTYTRYADGTQICHSKNSDTGITCPGGFRGGAISPNFTTTWPAAFVGTIPDILITTNNVFGVIPASTTLTGATYNYLSVTTFTTAATTNTWIVAIGRWF